MLHCPPPRPIHQLLLVSLLLVSCSRSPEMASEGAGVANTAAEQANFPTEAVKADAARQGATDGAPKASPNAPRTRPQLIKTATLALKVKTVETAVEQLTAILQHQQGDVLFLNYEQPYAGQAAQDVNLQVRVPQANLESTLEKFSELGMVTRQSITAEDVSDQLVDLGARLRNLRKAEESVLKILDRTRSISEVLTVQQELQRIRQEIEQIDARRNDLQNRVAYSLITIELDAIASIVSTRTPLGEQFQGTWRGATQSVQDFTVTMLRLLLWVLAWSPYWGGFVVGALLLQQWRKKREQPVKPEQ